MTGRDQRSNHYATPPTDPASVPIITRTRDAGAAPYDGDLADTLERRPSPSCTYYHANLEFYRSTSNHRSVRTENFRWKWPPPPVYRLLRSLSTIESDRDRSATYDFLLVISSNHGPISHCFRGSVDSMRKFSSKSETSAEPIKLHWSRARCKSIDGERKCRRLQTRLARSRRQHEWHRSIVGIRYTRGVTVGWLN